MPFDLPRRGVAPNQVNDMEEDFIVTVDDWHNVRNISGHQYCTRGAKQWARTHKLDFDKFVMEGLPASQFLATGDALALEFVEAARERRRRG